MLGISLKRLLRRASASLPSPSTNLRANKGSQDGHQQLEQRAAGGGHVGWASQSPPRNVPGSMRGAGTRARQQQGQLGAQAPLLSHSARPVKKARTESGAGPSRSS